MTGVWASAHARFLACSAPPDSALSHEDGDRVRERKLEEGLSGAPRDPGPN